LKNNFSYLKKKLKLIKIYVSDVDGVLTDGGMYYTEAGLIMKKFNVKDGMGSVQLKKNGVKTGIITSDTSLVTKIRSERLKVDYIFIGSLNKIESLKEIQLKENISAKEIAFIGDDINDIEVLKSVGFSACPKDACDEVKRIVDYVSTKKGGEGCYREIADLILKSKNLELLW